MTASPARPTPIVTEIVRNALVSVTNEMKIDLMRSSYNPIIHEMLDFSVGLFSAKGETLAQAAGLPQFLCDMPNAIHSILADIGGLSGLRDGDVYLTGRIAIEHLTTEELDRIIGVLFALTERWFQAAVSIAYR